VRLLLDTHIWHWSASCPGKLHTRVSDALLDAKNEIHVSPISTWELLTLAAKKRIDLGPEPKQWIKRSLRDSPLRMIPLTNEVALRAHDMRLSHNDPGDRLIAATALTLDLVLVTGDMKLLAAPELKLLSNR
jgi:PIN domain nuclease of toxin-antitoxin system